jgi:ubiquitin-protein ligase
VRVEALYFVQNAQLADVVISPTFKFTNMKANFNTIQFPLMAEIGFGDGSIKPKLLVGGFYSYALNVQSIYDEVITFSDGTNQTSHVKSDVSQYFKHNQYGFLVGVGATIPLLGKPMLLELRYTHTLNNVDIDGFQYTYLGDNANKYGGKLYPTTLGLNVSYPIFTF